VVKFVCRGLAGLVHSPPIATYQIGVLVELQDCHASRGFMYLPGWAITH